MCLFVRNPKERGKDQSTHLFSCFMVMPFIHDGSWGCNDIWCSWLFLAEEIFYKKYELVVSNSQHLQMKQFWKNNGSGSSRTY
jgi:hypothetical protein